MNEPTQDLRRAAMQMCDKGRAPENHDGFDMIHRVANAIESAAAGYRGALETLVDEERRYRQRTNDNLRILASREGRGW